MYSVERDEDLFFRLMQGFSVFPELELRCERVALGVLKVSECHSRENVEMLESPPPLWVSGRLGSFVTLKDGDVLLSIFSWVV